MGRAVEITTGPQRRQVRQRSGVREEGIESLYSRDEVSGRPAGPECMSSTYRFLRGMTSRRRRAAAHAALAITPPHGGEPVLLQRALVLDLLGELAEGVARGRALGSAEEGHGPLTP